MKYLACENIRFSSLFPAGDVSRGGTSARNVPNHFTLIVFWCERRDLSCSHSNGDIFICEDNMLFSHVKITCYFHMWRYQVFARKLNWYFIGVYIINIIIMGVFNACTLVPTVFRWHGKMAFKCHLHFSFSHDIEKQIWILPFVFRFRLTLKNGFELRISFFFFASLWKTDLNFVFRFCIACYWKTDCSFFCHFCMNLKSGFIHQSFETPPTPSPRGWPG